MSDRDVFRHELNPAQLKAVQQLDGPVLILAGAGSGKTRALTFRFANLIVQGACSPHEILAVTFTNKAARNMEARVTDILLKHDIPLRERLWINTFHSTCVRMLRDHIHLLEYKNTFNIYDSSDQLGMIKRVITGLGLNDKIFAPKSAQYVIGDAKLNAKSPEDVIAGAKSPHDETMAKIYAQYEIEMKRANCLDFDDLLVKTLDLLRSYPDILDLYQEKFKYIMVDEYQDTNRVQYLLVSLLAQKHRNLCVVGDEDQSIYSWRGADIRNIMDFEKDFAEAVVIKLEENYRSSQTIVKASSALIKNNSERKNKECFTSNPIGDPIIICEQESEYDEARYVTREIQSLMSQGDNAFKDFAIFYRTNAQSRVLEEQLRALSLPYKLIGGMKFYERMEIKDILSYLKLVLNPADDMALSRIINVPVRGIGKTTVSKLEEIASERSLSLRTALDVAINERHFNAGTTSKLRGFVNVLDKIREEAAGATPAEAYRTVLDATQYIEFLKQQDSAEAEGRIQNLEEFDNAIDQFQKERSEEATLQSFLEEMALVSDVDSMVDADQSITMMTLHISKGLEFPYVFVVGMEENLFPSQQSVAGLDPSRLEEERRLAYVGMTRAEKRLYLTYARERRVWGTAQRNPPSRFIEELPEEYIERRGMSRRPKFMDKFTDKLNSSATTIPESKFQPRRHFEEDEFSSGHNDDDVATVQDLGRGMKVKHPTFGVGTVFESEGRGEQQKVSILFENKLLKKFVVKYARLQRL